MHNIIYGEDQAYLNFKLNQGQIQHIQCIFSKKTRKSLFLCRLRSIATHRDHFVRRLSICSSVCLSVCHTFLSQFPKLCFAGDPCIPRNAATIFCSCIMSWTLAGVWDCPPDQGLHTGAADAIPNRRAQKCRQRHGDEQNFCCVLWWFFTHGITVTDPGLIEPLVYIAAPRSVDNAMVMNRTSAVFFDDFSPMESQIQTLVW